MKKIFTFFVLFFLSFGKIFAHPLDISNSTFTLKGNTLQATTFFHSFEIEYFLRKEGVIAKNISEYYNYTSRIEKYIQKNIHLTSGGEKCHITYFEFPRVEEYQILIDGFGVNYQFECPKGIEKGKIEVEFFTEFELQTNKSTFFDANGEDTTPFFFTVFTPSIFSYEFDLNNKIPACIADSDGDGLSDMDEKSYKTNPYDIDTDKDGYTDYEEVFGGWYPLSPDVGPGQLYREELPEVLIQSAVHKIKTPNDCQKKEEEFIKNTKNTTLLQDGFANNYFKEVITKIAKYLGGTADFSLFYIMGIVIILGFIHAAGPGHSKSLLVSYILDRKKSFFDGLLFISIFTVTHLIDIIILFAITKLLLANYDISSYMTNIQKTSVVILFFLSLFLLHRSHKYRNIEEKQEQFRDVKSNIILGIVSGLVPCTFGWSIFLLLFSVGKMQLVVPLIVSLGVGIFLFLFGVLSATYILRKRFFEKIEVFSKYSSYLSSVFLLIISLYLMHLIY